MVQKPQQWIEPMADAGVDQYTYHVEPVLDDVEEINRKIHEAGMKVGLAIKPGTDVEDILKYIPTADMILVMTVEPGFGGQKFMVNQMAKVGWLRANYPTLDIEVDGGVGEETIHICAKVNDSFTEIQWKIILDKMLNELTTTKFNVYQCVQSGANMIVAGTAIINAANQRETISSLRAPVQKEIDA